MALKLQVPWSDEPLEVPQAPARAIDGIRRAGGPHVQTPDGDVLVVGFFGEDNKVPDVSRYCILDAGDARYRIDDGRYIVPHCDIPEEDLIPLIEQEEDRNILLLLESPHMSEYQPGNIGCPIAPANGATGDSIDRLLGNVLARIERDDLVMPHAHVIISNPIQFQTSLHAIHRNAFDKKERNELKNEVWKKLWGEDEQEGHEEGHIRQSFQARIGDYRPRLIINACTGGTDPEGLNSLVEAYLEAHFPEVQRRRAYHPSNPSRPLEFFNV